MATQAQALAWLDGGWRSSKYAKYYAPAGGLGIDTDGLYYFQCKDFANAYAEYLGAPLPTGNAIILQQQSIPGWSVVTDPQPGDLALRSFSSGGKQYGDVCIVLQKLEGTYKFIGQNQKNVSLTVGHIPSTFYGTQGTFTKYLRRNYEENDMITKDDVAPVRIVMSEVEGWNGNDIHSGKDDKLIMDAWVGHSWQEFIYHGWKVQGVHRQQLVDQIKSLNTTIADLKTRPTQAQLDAVKAEVAAANAATAQAEADAQKAKDELAANTDPNNVIITQKGWAALWDVITNFFKRNK